MSARIIIFGSSGCLAKHIGENLNKGGYNLKKISRKNFDYINNNKYQFTHSKTNIGLCSSIKEASKLIKNQYVLYAHDDMYFCKNSQFMKFF